MGVTIDNKGREMEKKREGGGPQDERKMKMQDLDLAFEHGVGFWHLMMVLHNNLAKLTNRFKVLV
jgi:hypothetical protein